MTSGTVSHNERLARVQKSAKSSGVRILLIEDNDSNRLLLADYLRFCGYNVYELEDGRAFAQVMDRFEPHLILLDLKLPGVDGYKLLEQIQRQPRWANIPVIIVSAMAFKADQQRAISLGASQYLIKPVNLDHLKQAIQEELQRLQRLETE